MIELEHGILWLCQAGHAQTGFGPWQRSDMTMWLKTNEGTGMLWHVCGMHSVHMA